MGNLDKLIESSICQIKSWEIIYGYTKFCKEFPDHTFTFYRYGPKETGLDVDILLDEGYNYDGDFHPMWLYFDNNLPRVRYDDLIPVAIHRFKPFILSRENKVKIPKESVEKIFDFIKVNYYDLVEYANGNIDYDEMLESMKQPHPYIITENDIKTLLPKDENVVPINLDRLVNVISASCKNTKNGLRLIELLSKTYPFKYEDKKDYVIANVLSFNGTVEEKLASIKGIIVNAAKQLGLIVEFTGEVHLSPLDKIYDDDKRGWVPI